MYTILSTSVDIEYAKLVKNDANSKGWSVSQMLREIIKEKYKSIIEKEEV